MKKPLSTELTFALLSAIAVASCGPVGPGKSPSPRALRELQNSAGCLDLPKLFTKMGEAKRVAEGQVDATITPDGKPMSRMFARMTYGVDRDPHPQTPEHQEDVAKEIREESKRMSQKDCESFSAVESDEIQKDPAKKKAVVTPFVEATPYRLVVETEESHYEGKLRITFEMVADQELQITSELVMPLPHECTPADPKADQEAHAVTMVQSFVWGDAPAEPAPSSHLASEREKYKPDSDDAWNPWGKDNDAYCKAIGKEGKDKP